MSDKAEGSLLRILHTWHLVTININKEHCKTGSQKIAFMLWAYPDESHLSPANTCVFAGDRCNNERNPIAAALCPYKVNKYNEGQ